MRGGRLVGVVVAWLAACAAGCEDAPPALPKGVIAIYDAPDKTILTPYPSDRYTVAAATATKLRLDIQHSGSADLVSAPASAATAAELDQMDGFSTTGGVIVAFDGPIDLASLERTDAQDFTVPGSPLWLIDVDDTSPDRGKAIGIVPRWWETPKDDFYLTAEYTLLAQPAAPLRPRTRYMLVVTDALKARDGGDVHRSPMMDDLLTGRASSAYAEEVTAALDTLVGVGVLKDDVVLATVFTTASVRDGLASIASQNRASAPPALLEPWTVLTPPDASGKIVYRGAYAAPEWRTPLPDGRFVLDAEGAPVAQNIASLEVFMAVSDAKTSTKRIPVIFGHGLGGDKDGVSGTAERLASLNVAVFGIDSPWHGSRAEGGDSSGSSGTAIFRFFGIDLQDATFVLGRARDNFRQMASDQLELVRLIQSLSTQDILPEGAPDGVPDLDVSRILYIGHSFGSVQGPTVFALAPELHAAVWNVGGSNMTMLLRDSNTFSLLVNGFRPPATPDGAVARFFAIAQGIIDPGDSLNYARFAGLEPFDPSATPFQPRDVLLQEVIEDAIVPNSTSEMLARAAGLENANAIQHISGVADVSAPVVANLPTGATGVISQFDVIEGSVPATHGELIFSPEGQAQYVEFFRSALEEGRARVLPQYP